MTTDLIVPEKDDERQKWANDIADSAARHSQSERWNKIRYSYENNFQKFLGSLNIADFDYVHSTWGATKPMNFANYPLIEPLIQRLIGEYTSRPTPFVVNRINKNAHSEKMNMMSELASEKLLEPIWARIEKEQGVKLPMEKKMEMIPDHLKNMPHKSIRDYLEVNLKYGLNYLYYTYKLGAEFTKDLYSIMINSDVVSKIDMVGNDPVVRNVPIQNTIFYYGEDNYVFEEVHKKSPYMGKDVWMSLSAIIMKYGHRLNTAQKNKLLKDHSDILSDTSSLSNFNKDCFCYRMVGKSMVETRVIDLEVKATSEKQFLKMPFSPDRKESDIYSNKKVVEIWEICKIGSEGYLKPRRMQNQIPARGDYGDLQFSYFGMLSRHSFYVKAFPIQMLYSTCMMTIDFLMNQAGGKATRMALEKKPDGYEWEDVTHMAKVGGLILEQTRTGDLGGRSTHMGEVDFGPSASIQYLVALAGMLEQTAKRMTGGSDSRSGTSPGSSPVGTVQSNVVQSTYVTKPIFDVHDQHIENGLQRSADLIRYTWEGDETKSYIGGDGLPVVFKVSKDLSLCDAGIYVQSSVRATQEKEYILQLGEKTLATDATMILELVKMFNSDSGAEALDILELGIGAIRANANAMEKAKSDAQMQLGQLKMEELGIKKEDIRTKRTIPVVVAKIDKEKGENVALINAEKSINSDAIKSRAALDQSMAEDANAQIDQPQEAAATPAQ